MDFKRNGIQGVGQRFHTQEQSGITDMEITTFLDNHKKMVPQHAPKWFDWDQTRKEQGTLSRTIMVSMWFKHETCLIVMIDFLKMIKEELDNATCAIMGNL